MRLASTITGLAVVALAGTFAATSSAVPPPGGPVGRRCAFNSTTDLTREPGWQTGDINAGPLVTGEPGTLICSIHVNNGRHDAPGSATESVRDTAGVVVMAPRPLNYQATAADDVVMCSAWDPDGGPTLYWVSQDFPRTGYWTTDPASACYEFSWEAEDPFCPVWLAVDQRLGTNVAEIWQDCEGYEPII